MRTYLFLDLDDTIFQTAPKCPPGAALQAAAVRRDGEPLSFMTAGQQAFFDLLDAATRIIPTTGRNLDAFRRVRLPFRDLAVLDFGGVVLLADGTPDAEWDAVIRPLVLGFRDRLERGLERLQEAVDRERLGATVRIVSDFDMPLYLVIKHPGGDLGVLARLQAAFGPGFEAEGFFTHANDNNLSFLPGCLGKERAVRHVIERRLGPPPILTLGLGDSLTDAPFLDLCDYSLVPRGSQLAGRLAGRTG